MVRNKLRSLGMWLLGISLMTVLSLGLPGPLPGTANTALARDVVRMSPTIREYDSTRLSDGLTLNELNSFIPRITIIPEDDVDDAGLLTEFFDSVMGRKGSRIEVYGLKKFRNVSRFDVYQPCIEITVAHDIDDLGCLTKLSATATRVAIRDRFDILRLDRVYAEVVRDNFVIPNTRANSSSISELYRPKESFSGKIVHLVDGLAMSAQYRVVVIDIGKEDDLKRGAILGIYRNHAEDDAFIPNLLPDLRHAINPEIVNIGELVIFDVYDEASLGLITRSEYQIRVNDFVQN